MGLTESTHMFWLLSDDGFLAEEADKFYLPM